MILSSFWWWTEWNINRYTTHTHEELHLNTSLNSFSNQQRLRFLTLTKLSQDTFLALSTDLDYFLTAWSEMKLVAGSAFFVVCSLKVSTQHQQFWLGHQVWNDNALSLSKCPCFNVINAVVCAGVEMIDLHYCLVSTVPSLSRVLIATHNGIHYQLISTRQNIWLVNLWTVCCINLLSVQFTVWWIVSRERQVRE